MKTQSSSIVILDGINLVSSATVRNFGVIFVLSFDLHLSSYFHVKKGF